MLRLIAAESAIFTIFVVAYLFYLGKSLSGSYAKRVLHVPVFYTICLLSSSLTIHVAVNARSRRGRVRSFRAMVAAHDRARLDVPLWDARASGIG